MMYWNRRQKIFLLEQLEMFVSAGLTASQCLEIIEGAREKRKDKSGKEKVKREKGKVERGKRMHDISMIREEIESGGLLSKALFTHTGLSRTVSSIIGHGESVGELAVSLKSARDLLVQEDELVKKCLSAMLYPCIIGILAIILTIGLMRGVVPQIVPMLLSMHVELPFLTKATIWISGAIVRFGVYFVLVATFGCGTFFWVHKRFVRVRIFCQRVLYIIPLVGNIIYTYSLSLFLRSLGILCVSGVPISLAYKEVLESVSFEPLRDQVQIGDDMIRSGQPLAKTFEHRRIPGYVSSLVSAGESSGSLGDSLIRASSILDADIDNSLKKVTSLIEPLMMVGVGAIVGSIALSIMMPIYDMSKILQKVH